jgi:uncharacterized membrane protein
MKVILLALVILISYLIVIGIAMYSSNKNKKYPPIIPKCPDYWDITNDNICKNTKRMGTCLDSKELTIDLNNSKWKGATGMCSKYQFSNKCNIQWDGISDNNELCK